MRLEISLVDQVPFGSVDLWIRDQCLQFGRTVVYQVLISS